MSAQLPDFIESIRREHGIVGRAAELRQIWRAMSAGRHLLMEGPVGVGKTVLAQAVAGSLRRPLLRIDGDARFSEQKLTGWFEPALILEQGYSWETFTPGPLVKAMQLGAVLFINELNRMPEGIQNILLPAMDEGQIHIPQLGEVQAKSGFVVIATQNPREFVATSHLSEALLDRMESAHLDYQSFDEELEIARSVCMRVPEPFPAWAVELVRLTRSHPAVKRGASVRAAISILEILESGAGSLPVDEEAFVEAALLALPNRIELAELDPRSGYRRQLEALISELLSAVKKKIMSPPAQAMAMAACTLMGTGIRQAEEASSIS